MSTRRIRPARARAAALAIAAALVVSVAACGNSDGNNTGSAGSQISADSAVKTGEAGPNSSPGVTDSEIRFASFGPDSNNPTGQCVLSCFNHGVKAYFEWRNEEDDGLFGRRLVLTTELDDQFAANQARALEVISADDTFASFNSGVLPTGYKDMYEAGIPMYTWALNFTEMNKRNTIFGDKAVICVACSSRFFTYAGTVAKGKKIAALGYGIAQPSKDCVASVETSVKQQGSKTAQTMAYVNDGLDYGLPNGVAPEVTAMKDAGVEFVATCFDLNGVKTLEQEMERQGMGDVPVLHNDSYDHAFIKDAGDLFEGDIIQTSFRPFEANASGSQLDKFKEYMGKTGEVTTELAIEGWINADLAYQGIKAAGPNFTRASVIEATNKMTAFTAGGMIPPIDWSRQHEMWTEDDPITHGYSPECRAFVRVKDGGFELIGDKDKPFACYDPKNADQIEPTPTNFE